MIAYFQRRKTIFQRFTLFIKGSYLFISFAFTAFIVFDSYQTGQYRLILPSILLGFIWSIVTLEVINLLEYSGVNQYNYGSNKSLELKDKWLGKISVRILLMIGDVLVIIETIRLLNK